MFTELAKKYINSIKEKKAKKDEAEAEEKRQYAIRMLDHTWSRKELSDYNYFCTGGNPPDDYEYQTPAQCQRGILVFYGQYFSPEEYEKYEQVINERRNAEVRKELGYPEESIPSLSSKFEKK